MIRSEDLPFAVEVERRRFDVLDIVQVLALLQALQGRAEAAALSVGHYRASLLRRGAEPPAEPALQAAWRGFARGSWTDEIDVRDFIQCNYTPYTGDATFLAGPTARTTRIAVWVKAPSSATSATVRSV